MCLARVLDDGDPVALRRAQDRIEIGRPAVEVHRHDRPGATRHGARDELRIDVAGGRVDVHEHGPGARVGDRLGRRDEGVGGRDHLVALTDAGREQGEVERARPRVEADAVLRLAVDGKLPLERRHLLAEDERRGLPHAVERRQHLVPDAPVLRLQIEVRDLHRRQESGYLRRPSVRRTRGRRSDHASRESLILLVGMPSTG